MAPQEGQSIGLDPLPELKLRERRSAGQVVENPGSSSEDIVVRESGPYTFILSPGKTLRLVDEQGHDAPGFEQISSLEVFNWNDLRKGTDDQLDYNGRVISRVNNPNKYTQFSSGWVNNPRTLSLANCPSNIQRDVNEYIQYYNDTHHNSEKGFAPIASHQLGKEGQTHKVHIGNNFAILLDFENNLFIAYKWKTDEHGNPYPPQTWERFDTRNEYSSRIPTDIINAVKHLRSERNQGVSSTKALPGGYKAVALDNKVVIISGAGTLTDTEYSKDVANVRNNLCPDPTDQRVLYFCSQKSPRGIMRAQLDESTGKKWQETTVPMPTRYNKVLSLQMDPKGLVFMFETGKEVIILEKDSLKELKRLPLKKATFDKQGNLRAIDHEGHLVILESNLSDLAVEIEKMRAQMRATGIDVESLFKSPETPEEETVELLVNAEALQPTRSQIETDFLAVLVRANNLEEANKSVQALDNLKNRLLANGFTPDQVTYLTQGLTKDIALRRGIFAQTEAQQLISDLESRIDPLVVSLDNVQGLQQEIGRLGTLSSVLPQEMRVKIAKMSQRLEQYKGKLYAEAGKVIRPELTELVSGIRSQLDQMVSKTELADWIALDLPHALDRLHYLYRNAPANATDILGQINNTRREINSLVQGYEKRMREEYDEIRSKTAEVTADRAVILTSDIDSFVARLLDRKFTTREAAEQFILTTTTVTNLEDEIALLQQQDPERAKELARTLKIRIANALGDIEQSSRIVIAETGQQMIPFGDTLFPRWEQKVETHTAQKRIDVAFISHGNGVPNDQTPGEIGYIVIDANGRAKTRRLFEDDPREERWRQGFGLYKFGVKDPQTITTRAEFEQFMKDVKAWDKPDSPLKKQLEEKRKAIHAYIRTRAKRQPATDEWKEDLNKLSEAYGQFVVEHHIAFLYQLDKVRNAPSPEVANGKGLVPKWQDNWVEDEYTESKLEEVAKYAKMQLAQQAGIIMLRGHAGTGKDVIADMFCSEMKTNRPKFDFNCSKWTTEENLTEVILLDASEGVPRTLKVPSAVLTGLQTPGAVIYLNEFNLLNSNAQNFLNSLADHKRSLALVTSGGKIIRALPSVLIMASINEGPQIYKGREEIDVAAGSRIVYIDVGYPPLYEKNKEGDLNPNPPYSSVAALRIARSVDSLTDTTIGKKQFIQIWDHYVNIVENGINNDDLTPTQKYDLEVILCIVQWGDAINKAFARIAEGNATPDQKKTLPAMVPLTSREMSRMAYWLSKEVPEQQKIDGMVKGKLTYEAIARALFERFYVSIKNNENDREKIRAWLDKQSSQKRLP